MIQEKSKVRYNSEGRTYLKGKIGTVIQFNHPKTSALVDFEGYKEWVGLGALSEAELSGIQEALRLIRQEHKIAADAYDQAQKAHNKTASELVKARVRMESISHALSQLERA